MANVAEKNKSQIVYPIVLCPWIFSDEFVERVEKIRVRHGLQKNKREAFDGLLRDMFSLKVPLGRLGEVAKVTLFFNREEALALARDIVGYLILPVAIYFEGDPFDLLETYGGRASEYGVPKSFDKILEHMAEIEEMEEAEAEAKRLAREMEGEEKKQEAQAAEMSDEKMRQLARRLKDLYQQAITPGIMEEKERFLKLYPKKESFTKAFYQAINDRAQEKVVGALLVLASEGDLLSLFKKDRKIKNLYARHLAKKFGHEVADYFQEHVDDLAYFSYFLQHLLRDTLKIDDATAAIIAIHLLNDFQAATGKQVEMIAFGDIVAQTFKWKKVEAREGRLILS